MKDLLEVLKLKDFIYILTISFIFGVFIIFLQGYSASGFNIKAVWENIIYILKIFTIFDILLIVLISLLSGFNLYLSFKNIKLDKSSGVVSFGASFFSGILATSFCGGCLAALFGVFLTSSAAASATVFFLEYKTSILVFSLILLFILTLWNIKNFKKNLICKNCK